MSDTPSGDGPVNPFEDFLRSLGGGPGGQMPDLSALFGQMQRMFRPHDGPVDFEMAKDVARHALAAQGPDPSPHSGQVGAVADAVRLAEGWLDRATALPSATSSTAAWSRAEWVENTAANWQVLVEPIATHVVAAMGNAIPEEARQMAGPLLGILNQAGGAMFGQQIGTGLAALASEALSSTDIGLPLGPDGTAAVVMTNVTAFGEGLEQTPADVLLYVLLRECAHLRLHAHAPWLRPAIVSAVEEFGRGTTIDVEGLESRIAGLDPSRLAEAMQDGLFDPERTPEQEVAIERLETLLAFAEGWVDEVVTQATAEVMPAAPALAEAIRRRRASGGPAEQAFASLVGLELRPRRLRDAANLWAALRDRQGAEARDAVWAHPDLMPTAADLDDPLGFAAGEKDSFDDALQQLLDDESGE